MLSFSPRTVAKVLLSDLPDRSRHILTDRFGLGIKGEERTLDAIGKEYGITRERIRQVERALASLYESMDINKLTPEEEFLQIFAEALKKEGVKNRPNEILTRWLNISKRIGRNPLGEWGLTESPHVRIKNTRDFA